VYVVNVGPSRIRCVRLWPCTVPGTVEGEGFSSGHLLWWVLEVQTREQKKTGELIE
jgi:hypothetical protein